MQKIHDLLTEYQRLIDARSTEAEWQEELNNDYNNGHINITKYINTEYQGEHVSKAKIRRTGIMLREKMIELEKRL